MNKCLMLLMMGCAALHSFAISSANSYVRISTDCPDVLAIRPVDRDFHLLVTNVAARVHVEIEAIDPWGLVRPGSGSCDVTLAVLGSYEVEDLEPDEDGNYEPNKDGRIIMFKPTFVVKPDFPSGMKQLAMDYSSFQNSEVPMKGTEGELTDNHTATVTYIPMGEVRTLKGHVANDVYVIGDARDDVLFVAGEIKRQAIDAEFSESWEYVRRRSDWTEYQAKEKVNYSAAWRYHCTYGNGSESAPAYEKHPAYR